MGIIHDSLGSYNLTTLIAQETAQDRFRKNVARAAELIRLGHRNCGECRTLQPDVQAFKIDSIETRHACKNCRLRLTAGLEQREAALKEKINVTYDRTPGFYIATFDDYDGAPDALPEHQLSGWGKTEALAIEDLKEQKEQL